MRNKKIVAQLAALSLVFGMAGAGVSWADEIYIEGTKATVWDPATEEDVTDSAKWLVKNDDGSFTVSNRDVKGAYIFNNAKLTANNVNFIDGGEYFSEVGPENGSTFIMNGGSIQTTDMRFSADRGSTAIINDAKVTTGAFANNSEITLKNCTTSGSVLYAGNEYPEENEDGTYDKTPLQEGVPEGRLTIDGGTAHVNNVLVQNKALFTVKNGATLDLTGDTSAWEKEFVDATGITNKGNITVRAWGPNTASAEKENNDYINQLDQASTFRVWEKSNVKADTIDLQGNHFIDTGTEIIDRAKFLADGNSFVTANTMNIGKYGYAEFNDSQLTVNGKLSIDSIGEDDGYDKPYGLEFIGGSANLNEVSVTNYGEAGFSAATVTAKNVTADNSHVEFCDGTFQADAVNLANDSELDFYNGANAKIGQLTADNSGVYLSNLVDENTKESTGEPDVTISQMTLKNESDLLLEKGSLHSDTVTLTGHSTAKFHNGVKADIGQLTADSSHLYLTSDGENEPNLSISQMTLKNNSMLEQQTGSLHSDTMTLTGHSAAEFHNDVKVDIGQLTADSSYLHLTSDSENEPNLSIAQMTLKNNSALVLEKGTVNSDVIQLDDSSIAIQGVGTLIANKMTLNNTILSLNGFIPEPALATFSLADVAPYAVTKDGVHVTVKDQLVMNGGTLTVDEGSTLETNKMALSGNSIVNVTGDNSSYTIKGSNDADNVIDAGSQIIATNGGTINVADNTAIKASIGEKNKIKTVISADENSTVSMGTDTRLVIKDAKANVKYNVKEVIDNKGTSVGEKQFTEFYGDTIFTKSTGEVDADGNISFDDNEPALAQTSMVPNIAIAAFNGTGALNTFFKSAYSATGATQESGNNALDHAVGAAEMAGVTHGTYGFAEDLSGMVAAHKADGQGIWAQYLHQDKKVDGFKVGGRDAKYDVKYNGFLIGGDFATSETSRTGVAFAYADGSNTSRDSIYTKNDTKYYGGDVYHQFTAGGIQYTADIGYIKSDNDLKQVQLGTTITGSTDGNTFFAGIRGEKEIALGSSSLTPYAGLRFYRVHTGDFTDSLGMKHETENANIWNLPVGVVYRHDVQNGNWNVTPVAELGYNFVMGDKDTKETVRFNGSSDVFAFDIGESSFIGRLGVEANNGIWTLGGGYRYQKGSDTQSNQWYLQAGFHF